MFSLRALWSLQSSPFPLEESLAATSVREHKNTQHKFTSHFKGSNEKRQENFDNINN